MPVRGIRGAITVTEDASAEVLAATRELLEEIVRLNSLDDYAEIVSAVFTTTRAGQQLIVLCLVFNEIAWGSWWRTQKTEV